MQIRISTKKFGKSTLSVAMALFLLLQGVACTQRSSLNTDNAGTTNTPLDNSTPINDAIAQSTKPSYPNYFSFENAQVVEETQYYTLLRNGPAYFCYIYDENHIVVKTEGWWPKELYVSMINDHLVRFSLQAGTGYESIWSYYYDTEMDVFSRTFYGVLDQCNGKVAFAAFKDGVYMVIVRDIFDKTAFYQEISSFSEPLSDSLFEPIVNAEFLDNGNSIKITYTTNSGSTASDVFSLN